MDKTLRVVSSVLVAMQEDRKHSNEVAAIVEQTSFGRTSSRLMQSNREFVYIRNSEQSEESIHTNLSMSNFKILFPWTRPCAVS